MIVCNLMDARMLQHRVIILKSFVASFNGTLREQKTAMLDDLMSCKCQSGGVGFGRFFALRECTHIGPKIAKNMSPIRLIIGNINDRTDWYLLPLARVVDFHCLSADIAVKRRLVFGSQLNWRGRKSGTFVEAFMGLTLAWTRRRRKDRILLVRIEFWGSV